MTNWNQIVFVTKLLLVKDSCNMGANNTITTASSSSSGAPRRPTSFLTRNTCFSVIESDRCKRLPVTCFRKLASGVNRQQC